MMTYGQYESFGESAVLEEGTRSASVITNMYTELLVLTKHDLTANISQAARESLEERLKQIRPEEDMLRYLYANDCHCVCHAFLQQHCITTIGRLQI